MPPHSCTPSGSSSRISIREAIYHRWSKGSIQSYRQSISNSSVHTVSPADYKNPFDLPGLGQGRLPFNSNQNCSIPDLKYCDTLDKSMFCLRNESQSTISTTLMAEPEPCFPTLFTPKQEADSLSPPAPPSVEDDATSSPPSTPRTSLDGTLRIPTPNFGYDATPQQRPLSPPPVEGNVASSAPPTPRASPASTLSPTTGPSLGQSPVNPSLLSAGPFTSPNDGMHTQTQSAVPTTVESSPQSTAAVPKSPTPSAAEVNVVTHVRALYSFEPTEPNELAFERGDIIKVVDRKYEGRWRGQLRGRTGIFPVNYVVRLCPTPTPTFADAHDLVVFRNLFQTLPLPNWQLRCSRMLPCSRRRPTLIVC